MSRQIQIRRGTADENNAFTGAIGEITMDTTNNTLRVHDGQTLGGTALARISDIPSTPPIPDSADYVIESQLPTAENDYTWYRKYKSGWVEQGGITTGTGSWGTTTVTLPIEMADTNYCLNLTSEGAGFTDSGGASQRGDSKAYFSTKTTTTFLCQKHDTVNWQVSGMARQD